VKKGGSIERPMNSQKILIVDDEAQIAERLSGLLGAFGWNVACALSGRDALEKIKLDRPDAIVLDMIMPEMDGFEVAHSLKCHPEYRNIPIVAATSLLGRADRARCLAAGCDDYMAKPFTVEQLQQLLAGLIERRQAATVTSNTPK
jgi:two-component system OmpR family response regulator